MAITATKTETFVMGNKRCELWTVVGSTDTGGTFVSGLTRIDAVVGQGGDNTTAPTALTLKWASATNTVTVAYTSGSPTVTVLVIGA